MKIIILILFIVSFVSCSLAPIDLKKRQLQDGVEINHKDKFSLSDYAYLEPRTNHYNSDKILLQKEKDLETAQAVAKFNNARDVNYRLSPEEDIEKKSMVLVNDQKWEEAFKILLKYEPILTYNKNMTNMIVLCSFKTRKYDFVIQQLELSLNLPDETILDNQSRADRLKMLAHAYYLSGRTEEALDQYEQIVSQHKDEQARLVIVALEEKKDLDKNTKSDRYVSNFSPDKTIEALLMDQVDEYARKYIFSDYSKDSVIIREEFKPMTEPVRLPASLELKKTK